MTDKTPTLRQRMFVAIDEVLQRYDIKKLRGSVLQHALLQAVERVSGEAAEPQQDDDRYVVTRHPLLGGMWCVIDTDDSDKIVAQRTTFAECAEAIDRELPKRATSAVVEPPPNDAGIGINTAATLVSMDTNGELIEPPSNDAGIGIRLNMAGLAEDLAFARQSAEPQNTPEAIQHHENLASPEPPTPLQQMASYAFCGDAPDRVPTVKDALTAILKEPFGCPFCDSGKSRKGKGSHDVDGNCTEPDCGYAMARTALAAAPPVEVQPPANQYMAYFNQIQHRGNVLARCQHDREAEVIVQHLNRSAPLSAEKVQSVAREIARATFNRYHTTVESYEQQLADILSRELGGGK